MSGDPMRGTPAQPARRRTPWSVLAVVAAGGAIGALARYAIGAAWPTPTGGFPWATIAINTIGCGLIGVLMVLTAEIWTTGALVRPFAGTGVLGGFTTFSTYAIDVERLLRTDAAALAALYLTVTPISALGAVWATVSLTRWMRSRAIG